MSSQGYRGGYVDPNWPNPMGPNDANIIIYGYTPSLGLCISALILFSIALVLHVLSLVKYKNWYFTPVAAGTVMELVGYIFRTLSSQQDPYSIPWFVVQYFFIVVAPVLFSAAIYVVVSRLIEAYGQKFVPLPNKLIFWVFICCDVGATILQVAGAALVGVAYSNQKNPTIYNYILIAGLAFQVASFATFLAILFTTLWMARRSPTRIAKTSLSMFLVAVLAVYLRTCFRLAESAQGLMQSLSTHEAYFGVLEFAPIVVAVYSFAYWNPGRWIPVKKGKVEEA